MNKLDKDIDYECRKMVGKKPGRGVILFVVEPDGVNKDGVMYGFHAECSYDCPTLIRVLIQCLSATFAQAIHLVMGKGGKP